MENHDFCRSGQWFCGTDLETPENRNVPLKSGHLSKVVQLTVESLGTNGTWIFNENNGKNTEFVKEFVNLC